MIFNHAFDSPEKLENMEIEEKLETFSESWREDQKLLNDQEIKPLEAYDPLNGEEVAELWKGYLEELTKETETVPEQLGSLDKLLNKN